MKLDVVSGMVSSINVVSGVVSSTKVVSGIIVVSVGIMVFNVSLILFSLFKVESEKDSFKSMSLT